MFEENKKNKIDEIKKNNLNIKQNENNNNNDDEIFPDLQIEKIDSDSTINSESDLVFKIIVIGNAGVGKSCLSLKATTGNFEETYITTVAFDFFNFTTKINNQLVKLQIWDTCGQEHYIKYVQNFFKNAGLAILVYAINDRQSFNDIEEWLNQIKLNASPDTKLILVGNKKDLENERKVTYEEGEKLSKDFNFFCFFESSAKEGINSEEIFLTSTKLLYSRYLKFKKSEGLCNKMDNSENDRITLVRESILTKDEKKKKNCC